MNLIALLSTGTAGINSYDLTVVATSITLVFCMLAALCLIITLEGKLFDLKRNGKKPAAPAKAEVAAVKAAAPAAPAANGGIPGEIVAAISAAVTAVTGGAVIRSIRKSNTKTGRRGTWGNAGVDENTRPFE